MLLTMAKRLKTTETLVINLRALMRAYEIKTPELAKRSGVSERMIKYILAEERKPTIEVAEALAKPFQITGWQLIMPNLNVSLAKNSKLTRLIENYSRSNEQGREYIDRVAEKEAKYIIEKK